MRMEFKFCSSSLIQCRRGWQPPTSGAARTPSVGCQTFSGQHFTSENNNEHLHGKDCACLNFCILFAAHLCGAENGSLWRYIPVPNFTVNIRTLSLGDFEFLIRVTEHFLLLCPLKNSGWLQVTPGCHIPRPALFPAIRASLSRSSFHSGQVYHFPDGFPYSYPHH